MKPESERPGSVQRLVRLRAITLKQANRNTEQAYLNDSDHVKSTIQENPKWPAGPELAVMCGLAFMVFIYIPLVIKANFGKAEGVVELNQPVILNQNKQGGYGTQENDGSGNSPAGWRLGKQRRGSQRQP